jgi:hypothetical protein
LYAAIKKITELCDATVEMIEDVGCAVDGE